MFWRREYCTFICAVELRTVLSLLVRSWTSAGNVDCCREGGRERGREMMGERDKQADRDRDRERQREREKETERNREGETVRDMQ